eukprot:CAMPEP_0172907938 /NCGR_PEP_ID=MMETSP1075-20121228/179790_1 /TAXON_ID=2916 /ORGANISM="Ceratium fusus, Strain PA161109" /LENGTH=219 /DNA_ID=CAMNT_0013765633 /DNA_START=28 /DNA_END=684 /DNA_ORIENTATION=-
MLVAFFPKKYGHRGADVAAACPFQIFTLIWCSLVAISRSDSDGQCRIGFTGSGCTELDWWTLQQWPGAECNGTMFRCFRMQRDKCVDTGHRDGNWLWRHKWYSKLTYTESVKKWTFSLCSSRIVGNAPVEEGFVVPDSFCDCGSTTYKDIRKLGRNSLGPNTIGRVKPDSDLCHRLIEATSSRLVLSTGATDSSNKVTHRDCNGSIAELGAPPHDLIDW